MSRFGFLQNRGFIECFTAGDKQGIWNYILSTEMDNITEIIHSSFKKTNIYCMVIPTENVHQTNMRVHSSFYTPKRHLFE